MGLRSEGLDMPLRSSVSGEWDGRWMGVGERRMRGGCTSRCDAWNARTGTGGGGLSIWALLRLKRVLLLLARLDFFAGDFDIESSVGVGGTSDGAAGVEVLPPSIDWNARRAMERRGVVVVIVPDPRPAPGVDAFAFIGGTRVGVFGGS